MGRIKDAIVLLLSPPLHEQFREQASEVRRLASEVRSLQLELTGSLEALNAWAAREYKRHSREIRKRHEEPAAPAATPAAAAAPVDPRLSRMNRRAAIIAAGRKHAPPFQVRHDEPNAAPSASAEG